MELSKKSVLGRPLTASEVDQNWTDIETAFAEIGQGFVKLAAIAVSADGLSAEFLGDDGSVMGTVAFPAPLIRVGGWQAGILYTTRHIVSVNGTAYLCIFDHTSGSSFAADLAAGRWTALGGSSAASGISFDDSIVGSGAGPTVQDFIQWAGIALNGHASLIGDMSTQITALQSAVADLQSRVAALEAA